MFNNKLHMNYPLEVWLIKDKLSYCDSELRTMSLFWTAPLENESGIKNYKQIIDNSRRARLRRVYTLYLRPWDFRSKLKKKRNVDTTSIFSFAGRLAKSLEVASLKNVLSHCIIPLFKFKRFLEYIWLNKF